MEIAERTGWLCEVIKISNLPYSHIFMNCIVAIMRPNLKGLHHNRPVRNVQVGYDMVRSLLGQIVYRLFRKQCNMGSTPNLSFTLLKNLKLVWVKNKVFAGPFMR